MRSPAERYLRIPPDYTDFLGGLRWSDDGSVIETAAGNVFAWRVQVQLFLEGFASVRPPLHFAHILHLMQLLGVGPISVVAERAAELRRSYLLAAKPDRNAGAFCAVLCREFAGSSIAVTTSQLREELTHPRPPGEIADCDVPPLGPTAFQQKVFDALERFSPEEMLHWFEFGCAPNGEPARHIADELTKLPPNLADVLAEATANRERLAGALALAPSLAGAITLPPRRLDQSDLPIGGYADVTTRGNPDRLLPSQYALEGLEFIRRFAEKELLFFRREEALNPTREELTILLDQGVRTWGGVRLALAGAVFALAQLAKRRKLAVRFATTGDDGEIVDPLEIEPSKLGEILETSDLTPNPALALENVLDADSERLRDVVILTHPRSLIQDDVADACNLLRETDRLFAVTVDSNGVGELCELRDGQPVTLGRFRVDLASALNPPKPKPAFQHALPEWSGDVEPIPFPFWFGPMGDIEVVAIDRESQWLLTVCANGMLHAQRLDGSAREVLPRGMVGSRVVRHVDDAFGVNGGFVICGSIDQYQNDRLFQLQSAPNQPFHPDHALESVPVAVHYDFRTRRVTARKMQSSRTRIGTWNYFADLHSIVHIAGKARRALDLETGGIYPDTGNDLSLTSRAQIAFEHASTASQRPHRIPPKNAAAQQSAWYDFRASEGSLRFWHPADTWTPIALIHDGQPALRDASIEEVQHAGQMLAIHAILDGRLNRRIFLIRGPKSHVVREIVPHPHRARMQLSGDGRFLAVKTNHHEVSVFATEEGGEAVAVMESGRCHTNVGVRMGNQWLLVEFGQCAHLFQWDGDRVISKYCRSDPDELLLREIGSKANPVAAMGGRCPGLPSYDKFRFRNCALSSLAVAIDDFGHVVVLNRTLDRLVAIVAVRRNRAAIWLPNGTRWGNPELAGCVTPGADEIVARTLKAAGSIDYD